MKLRANSWGKKPKIDKTFARLTKKKKSAQI